MPPIPPEPTPRKKGMLVAGLSTFGGSFLFSVLFGFELYESNSRDSACPSCRRAGKRLLIPLVGPWLAMPSAQRPDSTAAGYGRETNCHVRPSLGLLVVLWLPARAVLHDSGHGEDRAYGRPHPQDPAQKTGLSVVSSAVF